MIVTEPDFPVFHLGHENGWGKVSGEMVFQNDHIGVECAAYTTPQRQNSPIPWYVVHRKVAVAIAPVACPCAPG